MWPQSARFPALALAVAIMGCSTVGDVPRYIREQSSINVKGSTELWQLAWDEKPKPSTYCGPEEVTIANTCPCSGFAYAEYGKLSLRRGRNGQEVERMDLAPLFADLEFSETGKLQSKVFLQRWPALDTDLDRKNRGDTTLVADIKRRTAPRIMQVADYDHDGSATEFLIQVGTAPCGKLQFAAVGVSAQEPRLHALGSAKNPDKPLIMPLHAWQALLKEPGQSAITTWPCGDHGSDIRSELVVSASNGEIQVKARNFTCPEDGSAEKLVEEADW